MAFLNILPKINTEDNAYSSTEEIFRLEILVMTASVGSTADVVFFTCSSRFVLSDGCLVMVVGGVVCYRFAL